jgi:nucleoside-diphosphate-sugar epimerase
VRALHRNPDALPARNMAFEWRRGDAMSAADVETAADGVSLIIHAVNPPGYRDWDRLVLPMIDNTIAAARRSGARVVLPGTVYNFGPDSFPLITEASAQRPVTRKGRIRVELERRLQAAAEQGVRSLVVRAGDFFGPNSGSNWFSGAMLTSGKRVRAISYPGADGIGHQWAYIPDVAETILRLVEREAALGKFAVFHMKGHWDDDGTRMIAAIRHAVGRQVKVRAFPWWALPLLSKFSVLLRELREMRYLWETPIRMDNRRLTQMLGAEPHTAWNEAVDATLRSMGCLPSGHSMEEKTSREAPRHT